MIRTLNSLYFKLPSPMRLKNEQFEPLRSSLSSLSLYPPPPFFFNFPFLTLSIFFFPLPTSDGPLFAHLALWAELWLYAGISAPLIPSSILMFSRFDADASVQVQPRHVFETAGTSCGALGPGRDSSRRVHCNYRGAVEEPPPHTPPPIGSGHYIHTFLFHISSAPRPSGDRTNQRV